MNAAVRAQLLRDINARRFSRLSALLQQMYASSGNDDLGAAVDAAHTCERLAAEAHRLRCTLADLDRQLDREIRTIVADLDLESTAAQTPLRRWWNRVRGTPSPDADLDTGDGVDDDLRQHHRLAAYGLGAFEVLVDGTPVPKWVSRRGESVLKLLLIRGGDDVHREALMASLWPETPYAQARNRLNVAIHGLRRSLEPCAAGVRIIVFRGDSYGFADDVERWFDVDEFQDHVRRGRRHHRSGYTEAAMSEFRRAVALYAGDLFTDDRTSDWADSTRRRLRRRYVEILDELSDRALVTGDLRACLHWSERLLDAEPWHESAHARLMRVHARRGQSYLAMRQFVECARLLRSELDTAPGSDLIELYEEIRRGRGADGRSA
jgi:DNA-binding SARP family transcriptional activator